MSKLLLCSFKHTFMRRAHFFTVLCVLLILKVLCGVVALCFVLHSLRFSIAWFRSVYGCFMLFLYHTRSFVQTGWCFFSFLRLCVDWWRHYRLHSIIFGFVLFWGSNKPHLHTILPQWKENFIGYPMARNELFEFGLYFLSRFFTFHFVPFLFVSLLLISTHTHTHTQPDGRCKFHVSCIFFKRSKHKYANNSNAFHMWSVCCFYWVCNLYESYSNGRKNL